MSKKLSDVLKKFSLNKKVYMVTITAINPGEENTEHRHGYEIYNGVDTIPENSIDLLLVDPIISSYLWTNISLHILYYIQNGKIVEIFRTDNEGNKLKRFIKLTE